MDVTRFIELETYNIKRKEMISTHKRLTAVRKWLSVDGTTREGAQEAMGAQDQELRPASG